MKALVKTKKGPGLELLDIKKPEIRPNEVLIKVKKSAICGTDIHIYKWDNWAEKTLSPPLTIGHEFTGVVEAVGKEVTRFKVSDRVSGEGHLTCSKCPFCLEGKKHLCPNTKGIGIHTDGAFAEYLALPEENAFFIPDTVSDDMAAIFDPYGNAVHTALSFDLVGKDVLITGAGPIGLMSIAIAKKAGARTVTITDINPYRLQLAKNLQADAVVHAEKDSLDLVKKTLNIPWGFHVGFEMSGHKNGLYTLFKELSHGGKIALLGIFPEPHLIDWDPVIFKMLTIKGIYGREIFSTWHQMIALLESGLDIKSVITHQFSYKDYERAFQTMLSRDSGKVILNWE